jgi:hypothetical protein
VTFTRYWQARVGIILLPDENELAPKYGLGLEQSCLAALRVSHSSGIYRNVLAKRHVLFINRPLRHVEYFRGLCADEQIITFQKVLLVPLIVHGEEGYALLGLPASIGSLDYAFEPVVKRLTLTPAIS